MSKKSVKMGVTYAVTIILTLAVAGGVCWYMFKSLLSDEKKDPTSGIVIEQMVSGEEYVPDAKDNRTILLMLDAEKRSSATCFLVARFLVPEMQVIFMPLPSNTAAEVGGSSDTLYNYYRNGGTASAIKAVESCTGIKIDKYIRFSKESFSTAVSIFGGVDYDIPYNLIYDNPETGEETIIREGRTYLDAELIRKVITYPNFKSGEEYRAKCLGVIASELLKGSVDSSFAEHIDDYYSAIINSDAETDITSYDYNEVSEAMKYVARNSDNISMFVISSGTVDENNMYVLDENFVKSITEWLKLY